MRSNPVPVSPEGVVRSNPVPVSPVPHAHAKVAGMDDIPFTEVRFFCCLSSGMPFV